MISVIMPSYLGDYKRAAKDREKKIRRAADSVLSQTISVELVVVADGCDKTVNILNKYYHGKLNGYRISKCPMWSGTPRNIGIEKAKNDIVCYLDIDDYMEPNHCEFIVNRFGDNDWVWFNDRVFHHKRWSLRNCNVNKRGFCGTSNLAHKKIALWPVNGTYAHDWVFVQSLMNASKKFKFIGSGGYNVCHIPGRYDI